MILSNLTWEAWLTHVYHGLEIGHPSDPAAPSNLFIEGYINCAEVPSQHSPQAIF
jgi:hypothetical protein